MVFGYRDGATEALVASRLERRYDGVTVRVRGLELLDTYQRATRLGALEKLLMIALALGGLWAARGPLRRGDRALLPERVRARAGAGRHLVLRHPLRAPAGAAGVGRRGAGRLGAVAAPGGAHVTATGARRVRATRRGRTVLGLPWAVAAAALAIGLAAGAWLFYMTRGSNFHVDDWSFMVDRSGHSAAVFLDPHNEHLSLLPVVLYKTLFEVVGLGHFGVFRAGPDRRQPARRGPAAARAAALRGARRRAAAVRAAAC